MDTNMTSSKKIHSIQEFKRRSIALFEKYNYIQRGTVITWRKAMKAKWQDGSNGFSGQFWVSHPSHKTTLVVASYHDGDLMVR